MNFICRQATVEVHQPKPADHFHRNPNQYMFSRDRDQNVIPVNDLSGPSGNFRLVSERVQVRLSDWGFKQLAGAGLTSFHPSDVR